MKWPFSMVPYIYTHTYIYIYIYVNSPLNHGFYEDKPQEEVAGGGVGLGRSGWVGRRREVCPGLSIPATVRTEGPGTGGASQRSPRPVGCTGSTWPSRHRRSGLDGMGWGPVGGSPWYLLSFVIVFPSVQVGPLPALPSRPRGHVAPSKGLLLSKHPPFPFPTQPQQLSSFEASAKKSCEKGAA